MPMSGKTVCVLPAAEKYNQCPVSLTLHPGPDTARALLFAVTEEANPLFFEEVVAYDERGVAIKVPPSYALATRCPVLTYATLLPGTEPPLPPTFARGYRGRE
eukprot:3939743-Rhodomonas_salina.2